VDEAQLGVGDQQQMSTVGPSSTVPTEAPQLAAAEALCLATVQASRALHAALRMSIPDLLADGPRSIARLN